MAKGNEVTLNTILEQFREDARNNRDRGECFERMIEKLLGVDPIRLATGKAVYAFVDGALWAARRAYHSHKSSDKITTG